MDVAEDWQTVKPKNAKNAKRAQQRKETEKQERLNGGSTLVVKKSVKADAPVAADAADSSDAKKRSAPKKPKGPKPAVGTREQMGEFIRQLLLNSPPPSNSLSIAAVGEKIFTITKMTWSKKFKGKFGSLRDFIESSPELFEVVEDTVYLTGAAPVRKGPKPSKVAKAAAAKESKNAVKTGGASNVSPRSVSPKSRRQDRASSGIVKSLAVFGLLAAVGVTTLASVGVIDLVAAQAALLKAVQAASGQ